MNGPYDIIVLGGGSAGLSVASGGAALGARVALIEAGVMGGECLNTGCVPSKALIKAARLARSIRRAGEYGLGAALARTDLAAVMARVRAVKAKLAPRDSRERFEKLGVEVFYGRGEVRTPDTVKVGERILKGRSIVLATGSRPVIPDIPGMAGVRCRTNEDIFDLDELPRRLLVLGGGATGLELGQAFRALGSEVTIIERGPRLLPGDDAEAGALLENALRKDGIELLLSAEAIGVREKDGLIELDLRAGAGKSVLTGDCLLAAAGRRPSLAAADLETAGIGTDGRGYIATDARMRTNIRNIYACGDAAGRFQFTHMAEYQAGIVLRNILLKLPAKADHSLAAWALYTTPEIAHTGCTEQRAAGLGLFREALTIPLREIDRAVIEGEEEGFLKLVLGKHSRVLGATLVSQGASEILPALALAVKSGMSASAFAGLILPYPTDASILRVASLSFLRRSLKDWMKALLKKFVLN